MEPRVPTPPPAQGRVPPLWIIRIGAACRQHDTTYSQFMHGLSTAGVEIDRKMLADMAVRDPDAFKRLIDIASES